MHHIIVEPKAIWVNKGTLAYNIQEVVQNEYETRLTDELVGQLERQKVKLEMENKLSFDDVFSKQGIIYEYGTYLTLDEIMGMEVMKEANNIEVNNILVDFSDSNEHKTYLYLIGREERPIYKVTIPSRLETHSRILQNVNLDNNNIKYQPSVTWIKKEYIRGNIFLPIISESEPMIYDLIAITNNVKQDTVEETKNKLFNYVNGFFTNPLVKEVEDAEDGSIIYREGQKTSVRYSPAGVLEFSITSATEADHLSKLEKMIAVHTFIDECKGIPKSIKQGLYLSNIIEDKSKGETIYQFDYQYDGIQVFLTNQFKEALNINAMLELVVKNNQIVKGKWPLLDIELDSEHSQQKGELTRDFKSVIDELYNGKTIEELTCTYIIESIDKPIMFNWIIKYDELESELENKNINDKMTDKNSSTPSGIETKNVIHNLARE
ncbi:hypothetical protein [Cellulosilyticum ruminicola]|uniref:hypothetical protein n=1 Tax=Cellulosilyticum ruminicola TaxID=425254 RepID=UPI0006D26473|nr:hypothetical protein [Cellulosilyticum ruminicola]